MLQKYFIAIVPPEPVLKNIEDVKQQIFNDFKIKGALRSPAHITLHMPFSWEEQKEQRLLDSLWDFQFKETVQIKLDDFSCFEPRVLFINVAENSTLTQLQSELVKHAKKHLQLFNQSDDMRGFHPHVTVAFRDLKKPQFYKLWEEYTTKSFKAEFKCHSFCLMKHNTNNWEVYKEFTFNSNTEFLL